MNRLRFILAILVLALSATVSVAQTTSFTYQGRFTDGGTAADGTYDMQFKLFDAVGNQIGSTITNGAVSVTSGVFTVQLDYGAVAFPGVDRFLEIGVRRAGSGDSYTVLSPRQPLTSTPYAIRAGTATISDTATNATQLGGVAANQFVQTNDTRLSDARAPNPGSSSYIQNTNAQQAANFNINGSGTVSGSLSGGIVNATSQYNLGGVRAFNILGTSNVFVGQDAGLSNSSGLRNSFFGANAGLLNTTGIDNSFVGALAGDSNTTGFSNSFMGSGAGSNNTTGNQNSFFGKEAGAANQTTGNNSFFGYKAGTANMASSNSFFGSLTGIVNTTGANNAFFGMEAGTSNTTGSNNSFFGYFAGQSNKSGEDNAYFGTGAGKNTVNAKNSFFGSGAGSANDGLGFNSFFGYLSGRDNTGSGNSYLGAEAGKLLVQGFENTFIGQFSGRNTLFGSYNTALGAGIEFSENLENATAIGARARVDKSNSLVLGGISGINDALGDTNVGIGTTTPNFRLTIKTPTSNYGWVHTDGTITVGSYVGGAGNGGYIGTRSNHSLHFFANDGPASLTIETSGIVRINTLGTAGSTSVCRNASNQISTCSSSLRYKTNIQPFIGGLSVLNRLRPITFDWKQGGMHDLGFGAEDIAAVEPLLVTRDDKGVVEGVKYDRITAVLVNAIKEQQEQIKRQQSEIENLKALVCQRNRRARVCK
jgi:hypothetical protein